MYISAPANFDLKLLSRLKGRIYETYGNLNREGEDILPSFYRPAITLPRLKRYVERSHELGIRFNYILNRPDIAISNDTGHFLEELSRINVDSLTLSSRELISFVKRNFAFTVCSSVYCKIDSVEKAAEYGQMGCEVICLDYDRNRDLDFIRDAKARSGAKIKVIANNICLPGCPFQNEHFNSGAGLDKASLKCLRLKLEDPSLIGRTGFIHPEELDKYAGAGVDFIKIGGRSKPSGWIIDCVEAYSRRSFSGNRFRLMNTSGSENRRLRLTMYLCSFLPGAFLRSLFGLMHAATGKKIFFLLAREKRIRPFLRLYSQAGLFQVRGEDVAVSGKKRSLALSLIEKALEP